MFLFIIVMGFILVMISFVIKGEVELPIWGIVGIILTLSVYPMMIIIDPSSQFDNQIYELKTEIDLHRIGTESMELRAEKQFTNHQNETKRYYDQSLSHSKWIFIVGIASLFIGLIISVITLTLIFNNSYKDANIVIAITGGIASILSNFVAIIFLKMYSEIVKSLKVFHERLVATHHLHFSNFLVSKIFDESLREKTWSEMALTMTHNNSYKKFEELQSDETNESNKENNIQC